MYVDVGLTKRLESHFFFEEIEILIHKSERSCNLKNFLGTYVFDKLIEYNLTESCIFKTLIYYTYLKHYYIIGLIKTFDILN